MFRRRQVADEEDVGRPGEFVRILRSAEHETRRWPMPCRLHEQALQRRLTIASIGAEIRKISGVLRASRGSVVPGGIDRTVQRRHPTRTERLAQSIKRSTARVAQYHIKPAQTFGRQVVHRFAGFDASERYGRVEVVEAANGHAAVAHQSGCLNPVGTVGGDDGRVRHIQARRGRASAPRANPGKAPIRRHPARPKDHGARHTRGNRAQRTSRDARARAGQRSTHARAQRDRCPRTS